MNRHAHPLCGPTAVPGGLDDPSDDLVAQHERVLEDRLPRRAVQPIMEIRAADPSEFDRDEGFVAFRDGFREDVHSEIIASMGDDGANAGFCLHSLVFLYRVRLEKNSQAIRRAGGAICAATV
jgi:hypothetical protein